MAVVAVLLNSKLYVANVGEPPICPRAGRAKRVSFGCWCVLPDGPPSILSLLRPSGGCPCYSTRVSQCSGGSRSSSWDAGVFWL